MIQYIQYLSDSEKGVVFMKLKKQLLKIAATAVSAALLISPAGITTLAAESTPIGYFETLV